MDTDQTVELAGRAGFADGSRGSLAAWRAARPGLPIAYTSGSSPSPAASSTR